MAKKSNIDKSFMKSRSNGRPLKRTALVSIIPEPFGTLTPSQTPVTDWNEGYTNVEVFVKNGHLAFRTTPQTATAIVSIP